jgi:hypothetical protein
MIVLIYPAAMYYHLVGGQVACLAAVIVGYLFQVARIRGLTGLDLRKYCGIFLLSAIVSASVPAIYLGPRFFSPITSPMSNIALGVVGCFLAYALAGAVLLRNKSIA